MKLWGLEDHVSVAIPGPCLSLVGFIDPNVISIKFKNIYWDSTKCWVLILVYWTQQSSLEKSDLEIWQTLWRYAPIMSTSDKTCEQDVWWDTKKEHRILGTWRSLLRGHAIWIKCQRGVTKNKGKGGFEDIPLWEHHRSIQRWMGVGMGTVGHDIYRKVWVTRAYRKSDGLLVLLQSPGNASFWICWDLGTYCTLIWRYPTCSWK